LTAALYQLEEVCYLLVMFLQVVLDLPELKQQRSQVWARVWFKCCVLLHCVTLGKSECAIVSIWRKIQKGFGESIVFAGTSRVSGKAVLGMEMYPDDQVTNQVLNAFEICFARKNTEPWRNKD
jgi:hypothetical protein